MPKFEIQQTPEQGSAFFERRRLRRIRMIVELTMNLISCDDNAVSHREARCLVNCARKAILDLYPGFDDRYDRLIAPRFDVVLQERFPFEEPGPDELVN
jgi:hypothetical protein